MSVSPTGCTTLAKGLGRGRSRSARATPPARQSATIAAPHRAKVFFMARKVTSTAVGAQATRCHHRRRSSGDRADRLRLDAVAGDEESVHAGGHDAVGLAGVVAIEEAAHVRAAGKVRIEAVDDLHAAHRPVGAVFLARAAGWR